MTETQKFMGRNQLLERLAAQIGSKSSAIKVLQKRGQMDSSGKLTASGIARDNMTAAERAVDRASKASGQSKKNYVYNPKTNTATKRKGR